MLAFELEQLLFDMGYQTYVLGGDNVRYGLSNDMGFSQEDRAENIRRIGEAASLFAEVGFIVISAFISPYREDRRLAQRTVGNELHEVYLAADIEACETRDPKGLYVKARHGVIVNLTGVTAPY
jgi:adenylyl-sulfate kinase